MKIENVETIRIPAETPINVLSPTLTGLPFIKGDHLNRNSNKIEIVTVPKLANGRTHQANVGINLDEDLILSILSDHYQHVTITVIKTKNDLKRLVTRRPDIVFSGVKYFNFGGEDLWLNDYLDVYDIAYMASNRKALDCESDKSLAKDMMKNAGIATAQHFSTKPGEHPTASSIPIAFPLFIKPLAGGDSRGVDDKSIVYDFPSFQTKVAEIYEVHQSRSLVETYLTGKEYSVGIFENSSNGKLTAMPIEIIVAQNKNGHRILDFEIKKNDSEEVIAVTDKIIRKQLSDLAKAAFSVLGAKSFGRIDIMMNRENVPHFMEANLMPGLREGYFYRACSLNLNLSYEQMVLKIADNCLPQG